MSKSPRGFKAPEVSELKTAGGILIYRLAVETFVNHVNNLYLILDGEHVTLVDVGSPLEQTTLGFLESLQALKKNFGRSIDPEEIQNIVITHGHLDHYGNIGYFRENTKAKTYIHEFDVKVLSAFEERVILTSKNVRIFLERSGAPERLIDDMMTMYGHYKTLYRSNPVDHVMKDREKIINGYEVIHCPGHCPGEICLKVDNFLITGDHILPHITPHQSPASIVLFCGLDHYLGSLRRIRKEGGIDKVLPGHGDCFEDLQKRIDEIIEFHEGRLKRVLKICKEPKSILEISKELFGPLKGYNRLLGLEEAGAHVEYLWERGGLRVVNAEEVKDQENPVYRYERGPEPILKQLRLLS